MTNQSNLPGPVVRRAQMATTALGMEYLGGISIAAAAASMTTPAFAARDTLMVFIATPGTSAADHLYIQMNNVVTAAYWWRTFSTTGVAAGLVSFTNTEGPSRVLIDLEGGLAIASSRFWGLQISNKLSMAKTAFWQGCIGNTTLDPTAALLGVGEWVNTTAQITQLTFGVLTGTMNAGSRIQVYGRDYP